MNTKRIIAIAAVGATVCGVSVLGITSASANPNGSQDKSVRVANTNPVPTLNQGEKARFRVVDNGKSLIINGWGSGMPGAKQYVSLIYTDGKCSKNVGLKGLTLDGTWGDAGDNKRTLHAEYDNAAYAAINAAGGIGSVSIREITNVDLTNNASAMATLVPKACAALPTNQATGGQ